jgi:hypothetical protein
MIGRGQYFQKLTTALPRRQAPRHRQHRHPMPHTLGEFWGAYEHLTPANAPTSSPPLMAKQPLLDEERIEDIAEVPVAAMHEATDLRYAEDDIAAFLI